MIARGGNPLEENSIRPGALCFDSDNCTTNTHFRQQFNRQFNRDRQESAGGRLAAAAARSTTQADIGDREQAGGRWLAAAAAHSTTQADICDCEQAGGRRLAIAATDSAGFECTRQWVSCLRVS